MVSDRVEAWRENAFSSAEVLFVDRVDAGRRLARRLRHLRPEDVVVVGLPRGGVPVAREVAIELDAPLDVVVVLKLGVPDQPELAMGAIGEDGARVIGSDVVEAAGVRAELERRSQLYRQGRARRAGCGRRRRRCATGATACAACQVVRAGRARRSAHPVAPGGGGIVSPAWPTNSLRAADAGPVRRDRAVLRRSSQTSARGTCSPASRQGPDPRVGARRHRRRCSERSRRRGARRRGRCRSRPADGSGTTPLRFVVFAHGSGSSGSARATAAWRGPSTRRAWATLLLDLLTDGQAADRRNVFDMPLTSLATGATRVRPVQQGLRATAGRPLRGEHRCRGGTVVGGRAGERRRRRGAVATSPVPGWQPRARASHRRRRPARPRPQPAGTGTPALGTLFQVVPGATHSFEEPGALQAVAEAGADVVP